MLSPGLSSEAQNSPTSHTDMHWLQGSPPSLFFRDTQAEQSVQHSLPIMASTSSTSGAFRTAPAVDHQATPSKAHPQTKASRSNSRHSTASANGQDHDDEEDDNVRKSGTSSEDYNEYGESDEEEEDSEDDDVPLASAHPEALKAQKSLRAKFRNGARQPKTSEKDATPTKRVSPSKQQDMMPLKPISGAISRSASERNPDSKSIRPVPRKQFTDPTAAPTAQRNPFGFSRNELSRKLTKTDVGTPRGRSATLREEEEDSKRPDSLGDRPHILLLPQTDEHVKRRNRSRGRSGLAPPLAPFVQDSILTMSEGSDSDDALALKRSPSSKPNRSGSSAKTKAKAAPEALKASNGGSSSLRDVVFPPASRLPLPAPMPVAPSEIASANRPAYKCKQRIYINDPQHHFIFEVDEQTTPLLVLAHLRSKGLISANPAWAVVEMWRNIGVGE